MGREVSALEIARHYRALVDGIVIDDLDAALKRQIEALGLNVVVTNTIMRSRADRSQLAEAVIGFAADLAESPRP